MSYRLKADEAKYLEGLNEEQVRQVMDAMQKGHFERLQEAVLMLGDEKEKSHQEEIEMLETAGIMPVVAGLEIRPLSQGVITLLEKLDHPFVTGSREMNEEDCSTLMWLLTRDKEEILSTWRDKTLQDKVFEFSFDLTTQSIMEFMAHVGHIMSLMEDSMPMGDNDTKKTQAENQI